MKFFALALLWSPVFTWATQCPDVTGLYQCHAIGNTSAKVLIQTTGVANQFYVHIDSAIGFRSLYTINGETTHSYEKPFHILQGAQCKNKTLDIRKHQSWGPLTNLSIAKIKKTTGGISLDISFDEKNSHETTFVVRYKFTCEASK
jgi:hypothetical protein